MTNEKRFMKYEPILFWIMVSVGILPLFFAKYYITLDGASHLYNGNIIKELLLGRYPEFRSLFHFNHLLVPNWTSHFLFALLDFVFPDYLSEKIVFLIYFILTPLFFRKIVLFFSPGNGFLSYLMILFCHNHIFYFGFLNFSFGVMFFFISIYYVLRFQNNFRLKETLILMILLLCSYFSHAMVFMITVGTLLILPVNVLSFKRDGAGLMIQNTKVFWKNIISIILASIPASLLLMIYMKHVDSLGEASRLDFMVLVNRVLRIRPLLTLGEGLKWKLFNWGLLSFLFIVIVGSIILRIKNGIKKEENGLYFKYNVLIWFLLAFAFLFLYLVVPDSNLLPERLILIFYLFFIMGIATLKCPKFLERISVIVILAVLINYVSDYSREMHKLSKSIKKIKEATNVIETGSLLLPLNYSQNWMFSHASGYLGSGNPIVVLENYEGYLDWFPVKWNTAGKYVLDTLTLCGGEDKTNITRMFINAPDTTAFSIKTKTNELVRVPYVVKFGGTYDTIRDYNIKINQVLTSGYSLVLQNNFCELYKLK